MPGDVQLATMLAYVGETIVAGLVIVVCFAGAVLLLLWMRSQPPEVKKRWRQGSLLDPEARRRAAENYDAAKKHKLALKQQAWDDSWRAHYATPVMHPGRPRGKRPR